MASPLSNSLAIIVIIILTILFYLNNYNNCISLLSFIRTITVNYVVRSHILPTIVIVIILAATLTTPS